MRQPGSLGFDLFTTRSAVAAVIVFGLICRLSQYAANTSLWHDEAFVALNVLHKSYIDLLGPLDWQEAAPPGFLMLQKLVVGRLGSSEYAWRVIPLLMGLAGVMAFAGLARRASIRPAAAFWAVLLMAASDKLIAQANEAKHFTLDVSWAAVLWWLALTICREKRAAGALLIWGVLAAVGAWLSFASVFVFAGTSWVLGFLAIRDWEWPERTIYLIANLWIFGSLALLLVPVRAQLNAAVLGFWANSFPDLSSLAALVYWLSRSLLGLFNYFWQPFGAVLLVLGVLGGRSWWRTGRRLELLLFVLPVGLALGASLLHRWPFGGNQHMVFAAAALLLLIGEGVEEIRVRLTGRPRWAGAIGLALVLLPGLGAAAYHVAMPRRRHEIRPVIEFVQRHGEAKDQLLVFCPAEFEFYTGQDVAHAAIDPRPTGRVWFIGTRSGSKPFPAQDLLNTLAARRPQLQGVEEVGAAAYLFGPEQAQSSAARDAARERTPLVISE